MKKHRISYKCQNCHHKTERVFSSYIKAEEHFCSIGCRAKFKSRRARKNPARSINRLGYVIVGERLEHRIVMEKLLSRKLLRRETVHHKNGNRADNKPRNLELFSSGHGPGQRIKDLVRYLKTIPKRLGGLG
jgi:HNH endonuclease